MNRNPSNIVYRVIRKSDKIVVPKKAANNAVNMSGRGVGGGKGFD